MSDRKPTIHETALLIRADLDREICNLGIVISTREEADGKGGIKLTVSSWSVTLFMNNKERLIDKRNAFLRGERNYSSRLPYLSPEADAIALQLQEISDRHFPDCIVGFDPKALEREVIAFYQTLKNT